MSSKLRVGVVFGGRSGEHEVSLVSAASVIAALDESKYEVFPVGINKYGCWLLYRNFQEAVQGGALQPGGRPVTLVIDPSRCGLLVSVEDKGDIEKIDVFFPVLHGSFGEDGTIQGLLEMAGVPYVGAGVLGSAIGMDKAYMKMAFAQAGLPIVDYLVIKRKEWEKEPGTVLKRVEERLTYPLFVKPANSGSSVGISKAKFRDKLIEAINYAARFDRKVVVEKGLDARELECSVLGNDEPVASVVGEIIPSNDFYDYKAKYLDGRSEICIPASLPPKTADEVKELAVKAFKAVDCAGMGRVDFFLTKKESQLYVNEINTIPGFTSISMYPKLWEASGVSYPDLIDRLIELALERHGEKSCLITS